MVLWACGGLVFYAVVSLVYVTRERFIELPMPGPLINFIPCPALRGRRCVVGLVRNLYNTVTLSCHSVGIISGTSCVRRIQVDCYISGCVHLCLSVYKLERYNYMYVVSASADENLSISTPFFQSQIMPRPAHVSHKNHAHKALHTQVHIPSHEHTQNRMFSMSPTYTDRETDTDAAFWSVMLHGTRP